MFVSKLYVESLTTSGFTTLPRSPLCAKLIVGVSRVSKIKAQATDQATMFENENHVDLM